MVYEDPTPTRHYDLTKDFILDQDKNEVFKGTPAEVRGTLLSYPTENYHLFEVFSCKHIGVLTVDEYLRSFGQHEPELHEFDRFPKEKRDW